MNLKDIPHNLHYLLAKRGGMERITRELTMRAAALERPNIVYSTQQAVGIRRDKDANKGCCPASAAIRNYNPLEHGTSGRTKFKSECTGKLGEYRTVTFQEPRMHVQGEMKRK